MSRAMSAAAARAGNGLYRLQGQAGAPTVIVVGNPKGGSGKSTTAFHLAIALLREGRRVGTIDLDSGQGTLSRYGANRAVFAAARAISLPSPVIDRMPSYPDDDPEALAAERTWIANTLAARRGLDVIVIDTPGSYGRLSRLGHALADILVTPLNDSFVDLDLLARVDPVSGALTGPGAYAEMVWEQKKKRLQAGVPPLHWIVGRNRLSSIDNRNKRRMQGILSELSRRTGFTLTAGFGERVVFRELFPRGLTLLDLRDVGVRLTISSLVARQELRGLVAALGLPQAATVPPPDDARPPRLAPAPPDRPA